MRAARMAQLDDFIPALPAGATTALVGERGARLSRRRAAPHRIARAILRDAPILILDEPTSAFDLKTEALIIAALERLMQGRTTFIIAHRLATLARCDVHPGGRRAAWADQPPAAFERRMARGRSGGRSAQRGSENLAHACASRWSAAPARPIGRRRLENQIPAGFRGLGRDARYFETTARGRTTRRMEGSLRCRLHAGLHRPGHAKDSVLATAGHIAAAIRDQRKADPAADDARRSWLPPTPRSTSPGRRRAPTTGIRRGRAHPSSRPTRLPAIRFRQG